MFFISLTFVVSYLCSKAKHTAHMCSGMKTLKNNLRTTAIKSMHTTVSWRPPLVLEALGLSLCSL